MTNFHAHRFLTPLWRRTWPVALAFLAVTSHVTEGAAQTVISEIRVSSKGEETEIEVAASQPLNYMLSDRTSPFEITLLFLNATFAFPPKEQLTDRGALRRMATRVLEREGSQLAELSLLFTEQAPYTIKPEGSRVRVRVELPLRGGGLVWSKERSAMAQSNKGGPSSAAPSPNESQEQNVSILGIKTGGSAANTTVTVYASGSLTYNTFMLERPPRVVVDFEGARSELRGPAQVAGNSILQQIRFSEFRKGVVRIVLELRRMAPYWIERKVDGIVIHLGGSTPRRE